MKKQLLNKLMLGMTLISTSVMGQVGTGYPEWALAVDGPNAEKVDWRAVTPQSENIPTGVSRLGGAGAGFDDCGELLFYVLHTGTRNATNNLNIYDATGSPLLSNALGSPSLAGLNSKQADGEVQVVRVPGTQDEWYIIYSEFSTDAGAPLGNGGYTPANVLYSKIQYAAGGITVIQRDVPLSANGSARLYTNGKAVSRTVNGDPTRHYLYLTRRGSTTEFSLDRFIIDDTDITWDANTGNVPVTYFGLTIAGSPIEISPTEDRIAVVNRNQANNVDDIVIFDANLFSNAPNAYQTITGRDLILQPDGVVLTAPTAISSISAIDPNLGFLRNYDKKLAFIEFSPSGQYLYLSNGGYASGGRENITYLSQIDLNTPGGYPYDVRLQIQTTSSAYNTSTGAGGSSGSLTWRGIGQVSNAFDGNMYFTKRNDTLLYVVPNPDQPMPSMLVPGDVDLSTTADPNIGFTGIVGLLPDQIDGLDYLGQAPYSIEEQIIQCGDSTFCVWLNANLTVTNGIIGMDYCMSYDTAMMAPTGYATLGEVVLQNGALTQGVEADYAINTNIPGQVHTSIYYESSAPANTFFQGNGHVICLEFKMKNVSAGQYYTFHSCELEEAYALTEVSKCVVPGRFSFVQDDELEGKVVFWQDTARALVYDINNMADYPITEIIGVDSTCTPTGVSTQTDLEGEFVHNIGDGAFIQIKRDIPGSFSDLPNCSNIGASDIMQFINGMDCYYTKLITTYNTDDNGNAFNPNPFQLIAADVNMNDRVRANDITLIQDRVIINSCEYPQSWNYVVDNAGIYAPNGTNTPSLDWRFIDSTTVADSADYLLDAQYPLANNMDNDLGYWRDNVPDVPMCLPVKQIDPNCPHILPETYHAILLGDVDGSWDAVQGAALKTGNGLIALDLGGQTTLPSGMQSIPLVVNYSQTINAVDFILNIDPTLPIVDVERSEAGAEDNFSYGWNVVSGQQLRLTSYTMDGATSGVVYHLIIDNGGELVSAESFGDFTGYLNGLTSSTQIAQSATAIEDYALTAQISMFPNPAKSAFTVAGFEGQVLNLQVFNAAGQIVHSQSVEGQANVDTRTWMSGMYLVRLTNDQGISAEQRLIIQQ